MDTTEYMIDQKTYLSSRVDDQINWYNKKSTIYQNRYKFLKVLVIILSVSIPFLVGLIEGKDDYLKIVVGIGGVLIAMIEGVLSLFRYQDLWLQYRLTSETLQREKIIFLTQSGPYQNKAGAFQIFVKNAEAIMSGENQSWIDSQQKEEETE